MGRCIKNAFIHSLLVLGIADEIYLLSKSTVIRCESTVALL